MQPETTEYKAPETWAAAQLPSASSILDRHLAAIGGRDALLSHYSTHATGILSMPGAAVAGAIEFYGAAPNRSLVRFSFPGVGEVLEGFDGTHGWTVSPMTGPIFLEGRQLEQKKFDSEFNSEVRSGSRYQSLTTLDEVDFEGRRCYKVRLVRKAGGEDVEFYDVATGLKAGGITTRETDLGTVPAALVLTDYRKFGNVLQPTTVRTQLGGLQQVIKITSIAYDRVPASVFELPPGLRALVR